MRRKHVIVRGRKIPVRRKELGAKTIGWSVMRKRIEVAKNLRGVRALSTLVHEMIHEMHFGLAEKTVLRLEEGIVGLIHDNPELFRELAERLMVEDAE